MPTVNEIIQSKLIGHQVGLQRYGTGLTKKIAKLLNKTEDNMVRQLVGLSDGYTKRRIQAVLSNVREVLRVATPKTLKVLSESLTDLASYEAEFVKGIVEGAIPVKLNMAMPSVNMLAAATVSKPFEGKLLKEWVSELSESQYKGVRNVIRSGVVEGQTINKMAQRIRGTRALQYKDGIMEINRRGSQAMVRTAINHTTTQARDILYKNNEDIIKEVQWLSTLDGRTTPYCQSMDGQTFPIDSGPRPPAHIGCRSCTVPITKSWRELGFDIDEAPLSTRASMNGQVPEKMTYNEWLKGQPAKFQDNVLGKAKGAMFRSGDYPVSKFVDMGTKKAYTLAELGVADGGKAWRAGEEIISKPIIRDNFVKQGAAEFKYADLSPTDIEAITEYTRGQYNSQTGGYGVMQNYLRTDVIQKGINKTKLIQYIDEVDIAIKKSVLSKDAIFYRGIRNTADTFKITNLSDLKPGFTFTDAGFTSATTSRTTAEKFAKQLNRWDDPRVIRIHGKVNQPAFPVGKLIDNFEQEIVFPKGTTYRITKVTNKYIDVEPVLPGISTPKVPVKVPVVEKFVSFSKIDDFLVKNPLKALTKDVLPDNFFIQKPETTFLGVKIKPPAPDPTSFLKQHVEKELINSLKKLSSQDSEAYTYFSKVFLPNALETEVMGTAESELIHSWAATSADSHPVSIFLQRMAKKEFNLTSSTTSHFSKFGISDLDSILLKFDQDKLERGARVFLRTMYENTQAAFKNAGIKELTLFRGQRFKKAALDVKKAGSLIKEKVTMQPLSSFSSDMQIAIKFADTHGSDSFYSSILAGKVPVSRIMACPKTGFGCYKEFEFIVLGGSEDVFSINTMEVFSKEEYMKLFKGGI